MRQRSGVELLRLFIQDRDVLLMLLMLPARPRHNGMSLFEAPFQIGSQLEPGGIVARPLISLAEATDIHLPFGLMELKF